MNDLYIAKTFHGLEQVLADEIKSLGGNNVEMLKRAVSFTGDKKLLYKLSLELRTALRILMPIHNFTATSEQYLYKGLQEINWSDYFSEKDTFVVDSVVSSPYFKNSHYAALKAKDAIVDQFRDKKGRRPSIDLKKPDFKINLHISNDECTVSLDSSGNTLNQRGYRNEMSKAPINEVLAAGIIKLSGWDQKTDFWDPMCGSGTFAIEAALIANRIAPGINRRFFGFKKWKNFDETLWNKVKEEVSNKIVESNVRILGSDITQRAVFQSKNNLSTFLQLKNKVKFFKKDFLEIEPDRPYFVIMNPPYDERLKDQNINDFYKAIGDQLKQNFKGSTAWILSSNMEALKRIGLKPSRKIPLFNGALECKLQKYEMYEGSRRQAK